MGEVMGESIGHLYVDPIGLNAGVVGRGGLVDSDAELRTTIFIGGGKL
jgi:hypothetical protein